MGIRGPLPNESKIKSAGKSRRLKEVERDSQPVLVKPRKPNHLTGEATRKWNELVPILYENGLLTVLDVDCLILLCQTWQRYSNAIKDNDQPMANRIHELYVKLLREFGMTPASRPRVRPIKPVRKKKNPFDGI